MNSPHPHLQYYGATSIYRFICHLERFVGTRLVLKMDRLQSRVYIYLNPVHVTFSKVSAFADLFQTYFPHRVTPAIADQTDWGTTASICVVFSLADPTGEDASTSDDAVESEWNALKALPVLASDHERCRHGVRWPHECSDCLRES